MSRKRDLWISRIRADEREASVVEIALDLLADRLQHDSGILTREQLHRPDFDSTVANREPTYLLRVFAVFENGLREAWSAFEGETTHPPTRDLIDAFAARRRIDDEHRENAHLVRQYRNTVVHDETEESEPLELGLATRYLCRFFSYLPEDW